MYISHNQTLKCYHVMKFVIKQMKQWILYQIVSNLILERRYQQEVNFGDNDTNNEGIISEVEELS